MVESDAPGVLGQVPNVPLLHMVDGRLARYYELRTNRPLYMFRRGRTYTLTYDDSRLPGHYGWKVPARLDGIRNEYDGLKRGRGRKTTVDRPTEKLADEVRRIIRDLDDRGRWISTYTGQPLVGQPKFSLNSRFISSEVFSRNIETLSAYLLAAR